MKSHRRLVSSENPVNFLKIIPSDELHLQALEIAGDKYKKADLFSYRPDYKMASQGSGQQMDISSEVKLGPDDSSTGSKNQIFTVDKTNKATYDQLVYSSLTDGAIKGKLIQFADNAAQELYEMASSGSPLWGLDDLNEEFLDKAVYRNRFVSNIKLREELQGIQILHGGVNTPTQQLTLEASRSSDTVHMDPIENQWLAMFPNIVSSAGILGQILEDESLDGSLIVMKAEFGFPTPHPITRECYFVRRSKKVNDHCWLIVDVSLDVPGLKYYRKPSGCLIEQVDGGCSKIIWVEHNEILIEGCLPMVFKELVSSGFAFLTGRWMTMLKHQTENTHLIRQHINADVAGRSNLLRLAHRMRKMNASTKKTWNLRKSLGNDGYILANRECFENILGRPIGNIITVAASVWLPFDADKLYDSLQCAESRPKWDISILGASTKEELHFTFLHESSTYVSVLNIKIPGMEPIKCLQACFLNSISMYMMWTFLDTKTMNEIMQGGDPNAIGILVSGAAVFPWNPTVEEGGSALTVSFESLDETKDSMVQQVQALHSVVTKTLTMGINICTPFENDCSS
ncbi:hypothetical protein L1987_26566 [Smallanthus sonchifolius]|uniref:Uncharacterized protein n=1 Tax=Smallanthus sonchifolius TaxID=185202 RepID=A0ACB9IAF2_9ASTR|nr:hypothetical protein L1987_26566 [Smallanthus sonchifolius]